MNTVNQELKRTDVKVTKAVNELLSVNTEILQIKNMIEVFQKDTNKRINEKADQKVVDELVLRIEALENDAQLRSEVDSLSKMVQAINQNVQSNTEALNDHDSQLREIADILQLKSNVDDVEVVKNQIGEIDANQEVLGNMLQGKCDLEWIKKHLQKLKDKLKKLSDLAGLDDDPAMFTRTTCASCDKNLVDLQSKVAD